jgi:hypothetical protein
LSRPFWANCYLPELRARGFHLCANNALRSCGRRVILRSTASLQARSSTGALHACRRVVYWNVACLQASSLTGALHACRRDHLWSAACMLAEGHLAEHCMPTGGVISKGIGYNLLRARKANHRSCSTCSGGSCRPTASARHLAISHHHAWNTSRAAAPGDQYWARLHTVSRSDGRPCPEGGRRTREGEGRLPVP